MWPWTALQDAQQRCWVLARALLKRAEATLPRRARMRHPSRASFSRWRRSRRAMPSPISNASRIDFCFCAKALCRTPMSCTSQLRVSAIPAFAPNELNALWREREPCWVVSICARCNLELPALNWLQPCLVHHPRGQHCAPLCIWMDACQRHAAPLSTNRRKCLLQVFRRPAHHSEAIAHGLLTFAGILMGPIRLKAGQSAVRKCPHVSESSFRPQCSPVHGYARR